MSTDSGEINALQGAGKSGVDSGIVPFNMKGLLCRILTYLTLEFEMGGGGIQSPCSSSPANGHVYRKGGMCSRGSEHMGKKTQQKP